MSLLLNALHHLKHHPPRPRTFGRVKTVVGLLVEATDVHAAVGELCYIHEQAHGLARRVKAEVVGVRGRTTVLMPLEQTAGLRAGCLVERSALPLSVKVGYGLLGRVLDGNGQPIDGKGPLNFTHEQPVHADPPPPLDRQVISEPLPTGIRVMDAFLMMGHGQRVGIFAGSGVGKSTLLGMMARRTQADVNVIALIGERGREVQEFIHDILGEEGLRRSVVIAVTGDQAAMTRVKGASVAMAVAEFFRDQGKSVLLMMDSVTRVAMAQREIGLAVGEPPTTRGYTPSVFALLPRLLERAGPSDAGSITGVFTVLVDGDDMNEPVADAVRGILDGHIVLSRKLAHAGHYPAIDVLASVSRLMPRLATADEQETAMKARRLMAAYRDAEDLIRIGAYKQGSNAEVDRAIKLHDPINAFLRQRGDEPIDTAPLETLAKVLGS
ncbi:MAG: FliI/YscN family ATPase [Bacteroidota bacterium]